MATIGKDPNARKRILFVAADGSRRTVRWHGHIGPSRTVKTHIEQILAAADAYAIPAETAEWLARIGDDLAGKLAAVNLIQPRAGRGR